MEPFAWITLGAAFLYTLATLCLKRSTNDGIGPWRTTFVWNFTMGLFALPFLIHNGWTISWSTVFIPLSVSFGFFLGQLLNCQAIHKGDVSVVTPILSTKVVFVAVLAAVFLPGTTSVYVWTGTFLSLTAILIIRGNSHAEKARLLPSILLGLASAFSFAAVDIVMQQFGGQLGFQQIVGPAFMGVFLWSLLLIPRFKTPMRQITKRAWGWLILGGFFYGIQATGIAYVLTEYGHATQVNILYSSRGLWSVLLVWLIGHWFSNREQHMGKAILIRRLTGSLLLIVAILLATID